MARSPAPITIETPCVIFDCDGVLVDSERLSWASWIKLLDYYGYTPTPGDEALSFGRRVADIHAHFAKLVQLPPAAQFEQELEDLVLTSFDEHLKPFEDAIVLVERLRSLAVPLAVASSSSAARLKHSLAQVGLTDHFQALVSGDEVVRGKPYPDIYQQAAAALGVSSSDCTAIEDAPAGVAAARAAGMTVIGIVRGHVQRDRLSEADLVVDDLAAINESA